MTDFCDSATDCIYLKDGGFRDSVLLQLRDDALLENALVKDDLRHLVRDKERPVHFVLGHGAENGQLLAGVRVVQFGHVLQLVAAEDDKVLARHLARQEKVHFATENHVLEPRVHRRRQLLDQQQPLVRIFIRLRSHLDTIQNMH